MQPITTTIRRLGPTVVLALVLAAFATGAAGAAGVSDSKSSAGVQAEDFIPGVTDFPSRLGVAAQTDEFIAGVTDFPSRLGETGERAAEARLAQVSQQAPVNFQIEESGFDWSAGATGALVATLLLLGAGLAVRTAKRSRVVLG